MGGEASKIEDVIECFIQNKHQTELDEAMKKLKSTNDQLTVENIVHPDTKMNALMAILSKLHRSQHDINQRIDWAEAHYKDFDMNHLCIRNPGKSTENKLSILHLVCERHLGNDATIAKRLGDLVEKFLAEGANPSIWDSNEVSPLMLAAQNSLELVVNELVGAGADVNFMNHLGKCPLLSAVQGGNVNCISRILSMCNSDVKKSAYYENRGAAYEDTNKKRAPADHPLFVAALKGHTAAFECILKNNFDLSGWFEIRQKLIDRKIDKEGTDPFKKYFSKEQSSSSSSVSTKDDIGHNFDGIDILRACSGNALAQACLIRNLPAFSVIVDQFDPRLPVAALHNNASILHLIASFNVKLPVQSDAAIDFVDAVRTKCTKYHPQGKYDWFVFDDNKKTPLDYCIETNEPSAKKSDVTSTQISRLRSYKTRDQDDVARKRLRLHIAKAYTALVFIETLKHLDLHSDKIDFNEIHIVIHQGDVDVLEVLNVTPDVLVNRVTKVTLENCTFSKSQLGRLQAFKNLEHLVICDNDGGFVDLCYFLGDDFDSNYYDSDGKKKKDCYPMLQKLKKLSFAPKKKLSHLAEIESGKFSRDGLEFELA